MDRHYIELFTAQKQDWMKNPPPFHIPANGLPHQTILAQLAAKKSGDANWRSGRIWSMVYFVNDAHLHLMEEASKLFLSENQLNPLAFQSLLNIERELVGMAAGLLHGDEATTGVFTSGGTESIMLALYAYRELARRQKRFGSGALEIVVPQSIHPVFEKAAHLLDLKVRKAPVGADFQADPKAIEKLITRRTILLAASAPTYPHGVLDPIEDIAAIARKHRLPLHIDACLGGFMLPWVERLGYPVAPWDFRVPEVTSISADWHKFGYGIKGASVILYRDMALMRNQFFVSTDWSGGIYASRALMGSRSGSTLAAAWAAVYALGETGYLDLARQLMEGCQKLRNLLETLPEIEVLGNPCMSALAYRTKQGKPDLFILAEAMESRGWFLDRQHLPDSIHLTLMPHHLPHLDAYINDLKAVLLTLKDQPAQLSENAAFYGLAARIPFRNLVKREVLRMLESMHTAPAEKDSVKKQLSWKSETSEAKTDAALENPAGWKTRLIQRLLYFWSYKKF